MAEEQSSASTTTDNLPTADIAPVAVPDATKNGVEDVAKGDTLKSALNHLIQGKRHLLVRDIPSAIISLGESCQLLTEANGPLCADNAEAHFFYGKALLEQSRLDLAVFDGGVPGEKGEEESESEEEEDEEEDGEEDEEGGDKKEAEDKKETSSDEKAKEEGTAVNINTVEDVKKEEDLSAPSPVSNNVNNPTAVVDPSEEEQPSTSSGVVVVADKEGEEELSNLELAWEVLEIAKIGYTLQLRTVTDQLATVKDDEEKKKLIKSKLHLQRRMSETHSLLGEVATESENYSQAVEEFKTGIKIMTELESEDSREIAQYYFQIGLALSFAKMFQDAIASFKKSKEIIELRISKLQTKIDTKQTAKDLGIEIEDPNYTEDIEISELKAIIPELDEKVADTIDAERENKASQEEEVQEREIALKNSPVKNPNPPVPNDISHLVKKKKKAEDLLDVPPPKRICSDATLVSPSKPAEDTTSSNGHTNGESKMET